DRNALAGARIGILREPMGYHTEPGSADFLRVEEVFDRAVGELRSAGAELVDPVVIPGLGELLAQRAGNTEEDEAAFAAYFAGSAGAPFRTRQEAMASPL